MTVLQHWGGHWKVQGQEGDQRLLGEGLSEERERQGRVEELGQGGGRQQGGLGRQCDSLMCLLAQRAMMNQ